jgi:hypothetical protein
MNDSDLSGLRHLDDAVLLEVVRQAEQMLQAQFQAHTASDQRGFTFCGLALTASTAALGAYLALLDEEQSRILLTMFCLATGFIIAAVLSLISVWPRRFCFPGNEPKNWLPSTWQNGIKRNLKSIRIEQAKII